MAEATAAENRVAERRIIGLRDGEGESEMEIGWWRTGGGWTCWEFWRLFGRFVELEECWDDEGDDEGDERERRGGRRSEERRVRL